MATEAQEQAILIEWFRLQYPKYAKSLRVSQGGAFRGKGRQGAIRMAQAKRQGYVQGEADIVILVPSGPSAGLVIEYKREGGSHKLTQEQKDYLDYMEEQGYTARCCRGLDDAMRVIEHHMMFL